ncbi:cytochrome c biogenesis protein CcsA [uncultured Rikenella sp.]|uniref:cytochrome c biogenesis protein CcsA n=1 Tax=uncultured Rikenella sp. TaxID=368003 RepID=UPI002604559A|nr:cytochrome c biogenesis protein CcsA [uncultured Rikenella sp.]
MKKAIRTLVSYPAMAVMLALYAAALAAATFVENKYGTPAARHWVYNNWIFYLLQLLLAVNFAGVAARQHLVRQKKWATLAFHYAFAVILLGAFVTHLTGQEGIMHIREGESSDQLLDPADPAQVLETLPFSVELTDFRLVRYPGSHSPSSFESDVTVKRAGYPDRRENIYMNNVLHVGAYRLYQSSYDPDEGGTVLSVNRDRTGTLIIYFGYVLLMGGMLLALFHKQSRFRTLARMLGRKALPVVLLVLGIGAAGAQQKVDTLTWSQLEENARRQMEQIERDARAQEDPAIAPPADEARQRRTVDRRREKKMAGLYAEETAVSPETGRAFGRLMVQDGRGRIEPVDTYAAKLLRKIYRGDDYEGLNPDQVLLGLITQPQIWSRIPMIDVGSEALLRKTGIDEAQVKEGYLAFIDVLDDEGNYIFADEVEEVYAKPVRERNKYDKELLKLDEKINIINALFSGRMLAIFPHDGTLDDNDAWYSPGDDLSVFQGQDSMFVSKIFPWFATEAMRSVESGDWSVPVEIAGMIGTYQNAKSKAYRIDRNRIEAEMLYNRLNLFKWAGFFYMGFGLLLILALIFRLVRPSKGWRVAVGVLTGIVVLIFVGQTFGIGLRWYIAGRPPVSNAYESMIFVAWAAAVAGLAFGWRSRMTMALAAFLSGVLMFVSTLNWMDPEITPLVPVLKSPWLLVHVAAITGSYGFFGIGFLLGLISLLIMACKTHKNAVRLDGQIRELTIINEMALTVGLVLLTAGTFLGAVWANESWGRYWGWDPKETWALITMIVYAFIIHARFVPAMRWGGDYLFGLMAVVGLGAVLMTFFGVNYYLSGMHSYGADSAPPALYAIWVVYGAAAVIAVLAWRKRRLE